MHELNSKMKLVKWHCLIIHVQFYRPNHGNTVQSWKNTTKQKQKNNETTQKKQWTVMKITEKTMKTIEKTMKTNEHHWKKKTKWTTFNWTNEKTLNKQWK
jgi:ribosomal protein L28